MILKALYDYYYRSEDSVPYGRMKNNLSWVIVINNNGQFIRIEDTRDEKGKGKVFILPKGEHTNAITPFLFWDNLMYALNYAKKPNNTTRSKHQSFVNRCKSISEKYKYVSLKAVTLFYEKQELQKVYNDSLWETVTKNPNSNVSFRIDGSLKIIPNEDFFEEIISEEEESALVDVPEGVCLITGETNKLVRIGAKTPIKGCKSSAKLVSFQTDSGYDSYGKTQGFNAPISDKAEFAYSTALNHLLSKDSRNKFLIGNRTYLFWASKSNEAGKLIEDSIFSLFGFNNPEDDDPNRRIEQVRRVFNSIYSGELKTSSDDRFYILGLAPNSARIAVTYWAETPLRVFAQKINRHFEDMSVIGANKPYMGLHSIIGAVTLSGKSSDAAPNLPDSVAKSIFEGLPYPFTLYSSCIRRIRAEQKINTTRAAVIKAYLNRLNTNELIIKVMLDKENQNQGYLCGRLFAVLEKIQDEANDLHTIRDNYLNAASATPSVVFARVLSLSSHHSENLSEGRRIFFEKLKQEIILKISPNGFPAHLSLNDQGRFFVGYYHQLQDFYTKKENKTE